MVSCFSALRPIDLYPISARNHVSVTILMQLRRIRVKHEIHKWRLVASEGHSAHDDRSYLLNVRNANHEDPK